MMPDRAERLTDLVADVLERAPGERASFLVTACAGDDALLAEVESLLGYQDRAPGFLAEPVFRLDADLLAADEGELKPGTMLGDCRVVSLLGAGGMGEVYLAEDTVLGRQVAVKLIQRGASGGAAARLRDFHHERRVLAGLNHPNIARLYGAAVTAEGRAYLVMEYVEGERLDRFCAARRLPLAERLALFRKVCAAVAYAHQHLVIHRDLKPANIRVTAEGEPKLLDFGIAKLLDPGTTGTGENTLTLGAAMTPDYASPEQVRGEPITTASDVYSLGVILYELLTGERPYRLKGQLPAEIARAICETEVERPSKVEGNLRAPSTLEGVPQAQLRGDLDNIVLKALRKEPARRYASVAQFSEDLQRHRDGLPVIARRETFTYVGAKFIRRHTTAAVAALLLALALVGGLAATVWQARRAELQRARAERRFGEVRRMANSLMFEIHDAVQNLAGSTPTRKLIVTRALEYLDSLAQENSSDDPGLQRELATAYEKVGDIQGNPYNANLGDTDGALASYRKAAAIRQLLARTPAGATVAARMELGRSDRALGDILGFKGDAAGMLASYRRSLALFQQLATADPADETAADELARAWETLGDGLALTPESAPAERRESYRRCQEIRQRLLALHPTDLKARRRHALSILKVGESLMPDAAAATAELRRAAGLLEGIAADSPDDARARREVGMVYYTLGNVQAEAGDFAGALPSRRQEFTIRQGIASADPQNAQARFDLMTAHADLAEALTGTGAPEAALTEAYAALPIVEGLLAADPANAMYRRNQGLLLKLLGEAQQRAAAEAQRPAAERAARWVEADGWFERAVAIFAAQRTAGTLRAADAGKPEELTEKAAACRAAAEGLTPGLVHADGL